MTDQVVALAMTLIPGQTFRRMGASASSWNKAAVWGVQLPWDHVTRRKPELAKWTDRGREAPVSSQTSQASQLIL